MIDYIYDILEKIFLDDEARKFKYKYNSYEEYNRFENPIYRRFQLYLSCITFADDGCIIWGEDRSAVDPDNIERRTFKIEIGKLPKGKAEDYIKYLMKNIVKENYMIL